MQKGKVIQIGKPAELYDRPKNSFVADFLGQTNLIKDAAVIGRVGDIARIQTTLGVLAAPATGDLPQKVVLSVRPQRIRFARSNPASNSNVNSIPGQIIESLYLGEATEYIVQAGDQKLKVVHTPPISDSRVILEWDISDTILLPE
ncbi:MAG: TOBE domain-containing protein [Tepidisphaeraceae bacterium]